MRKFRTAAIALATAAVAAVPMIAGGSAGAQDAGDCGEGAIEVTSEQLNLGGLLGAVAPIQAQVVTPINAPIASPNAENCNENEIEIGTDGGGGHSGGGGGTGGGHAGTGGGGGGVGGAKVAAPVGGASPRFAG
jgi:hypothetical protein